MDRYLSLVFLYNKASYKKIISVAAAIPISFLVIFLIKVGNPLEANPFMLMEKGFGGVWFVLLFAAAVFIGLTAIANALNGKITGTHVTA